MRKVSKSDLIRALEKAVTIAPSIDISSGRPMRDPILAKSNLIWDVVAQMERNGLVSSDKKEG